MASNGRRLTSGITFTPLAHNRLRCNWNGAVIPRRQSSSAYKRRFYEIYPPGQRQHSPETLVWTSYRVETSTLSLDGSKVSCPYCKWEMRVSPKRQLSPGKMECWGCFKEFYVAPAPPTPVAEWVRMYLGSDRGAAYCPHCKCCNTYIFKGVQDCRFCKKEFEAVSHEG